jgi:thiol-disulfide isomerase/thioredoxin
MCSCTGINKKNPENTNQAKEEKKAAQTESVGMEFKILETKSALKIPVYSFEQLNKLVLNPKDENLTYVINFWATWCKPCVNELPHFLEVEKKLKDQKVKFIYVSLDFIEKLESTLIKFLDENKYIGDFCVLDQKGMDKWIDKIHNEWSGSIPATLIFNTKDRKFFEEKFNSAADLEKQVKPFLP